MQRQLRLQIAEVVDLQKRLAREVSRRQQSDARCQAMQERSAANMSKIQEELNGYSERYRVEAESRRQLEQQIKTQASDESLEKKLKICERELRKAQHALKIETDDRPLVRQQLVASQVEAAKVPELTKAVALKDRSLRVLGTECRRLEAQLSESRAVGEHLKGVELARQAALDREKEFERLMAHSIHEAGLARVTGVSLVQEPQGSGSGRFVYVVVSASKVDLARCDLSDRLSALAELHVPPKLFLALDALSTLDARLAEMPSWDSFRTYQESFLAMRDMEYEGPEFMEMCRVLISTLWFKAYSGSVRGALRIRLLEAARGVPSGEDPPTVVAVCVAGGPVSRCERYLMPAIVDGVREELVAWGEAHDKSQIRLEMLSLDTLADLEGLLSGQAAPRFLWGDRDEVRIQALKEELKCCDFSNRKDVIAAEMRLRRLEELLDEQRQALAEQAALHQKSFVGLEERLVQPLTAAHKRTLEEKALELKNEQASRRDTEAEVRELALKLQTSQQETEEACGALRIKTDELWKATAERDRAHGAEHAALTKARCTAEALHETQRASTLPRLDLSRCSPSPRDASALHSQAHAQAQACAQPRVDSKSPRSPSRSRSVRR